MSYLGDIFTLLLVDGNYPFKLSAEEERLSNDDWAWLFLRLNPLYRHDYHLYRGVNSGQWNELRKIYRPGLLIFPRQTVSHPPHFVVSDQGVKKFVPSFIEQLPEQLANKDSRYFSVDKEQLTGKLEGLNYTPTTLRDYLATVKGLIPFTSITLTDFEAPRTFGIATWIDPDLLPLVDRSHTFNNQKNEGKRTVHDNSTSSENFVNSVEIESDQDQKCSVPTKKAFVLTPLPESCSWFYLGSEPLWQVNTWAVAPPELRHFNLGGENIIIGVENSFRTVTNITQTFRSGETCHIELSLKKGEPIPTSFSGFSSTHFHFLVCLDGYVKPQIDLIKPIAEAFKALHRTYYPVGVARGKFPKFDPVIFDPENKPINFTGPIVSAYKSMRRDPNVLRKHWRQVTIDVAGPLIQQYEMVIRTLENAQNDLSNQLTFEIRKRAGREPTTGDNWLKMALCVVELHCFGNKNSSANLYSQQNMREAFYDINSDLYWKIRGKSNPSSSNLRAGAELIKTKADKLDSTNLSKIRDAQKNGEKLVRGWYEFIATLNFREKTDVSTIAKPN
ncbi:MAG: hypothetical protein Q8K22_11580 [Rhodoferax sp.]|nr:hypothetical protein [Rhodoferax sp.]